MASVSPEYVVRSGSETGPVEAWAECSLPFEPKGWQRCFREKLCQALRPLRPPRGHVLSGSYQTAQETRQPTDVENLVFYNVGSSCFTEATRWGLRFERGYGEPPQPPGFPNRPYPHYYRYEFVPQGHPFTFWREGPVLARWRGVPCPALSSDSKPAKIWWSLKQSVHCVQTYGSSTSGHLGLRVVLHLPEDVIPNLASLTKPLFDGVVAAFHCCQDLDGELLGRLGRQLGVPVDEVRGALADCSSAVLRERRRLLWPWGQGVQWNPADDRCVVGQLVRGGSDSHTTWQLSGELFTVVEAVPPRPL